MIELEAAQLRGTFRSVLDASTDLVLVFDARTLRVLFANRRARDLLDEPSTGGIDRTVLDFQPLLSDADFRGELAPLHERSTNAIRYTTVAAGPGGEFPIDVVAQWVPGTDNEVMVLSARDAAERIDVQAKFARVAAAERRQAAELRAVLEAIGEAVLVVDSAGDMRLANGAAAEMLGTVPNAYGEVASSLGLDQTDLPRLGETTDSRVISGGDGRWFDVAAHVAEPSTSAELDSESTIVTLRDVTRSHVAMLAREAFVGVLSHELRTPVTTIYGYAKLLRRPKRKAERAAMLADIERESDRLYRIIEDLLALSRVEAGLTVDTEPVLLQHLVTPLLGSEARRWPRTTFEVHLPANLPPVFGDRTYVEQVIRNLLSNAAKYSPGESTVRIEASELPEQVQLRVLDRGVGIDETESAHLFDLFYRSPVTARTTTGAGIGLFVSRSLVMAMGGSMWAASRQGGGSEFGFSLRRCDDDGLSEPA